MFRGTAEYRAGRLQSIASQIAMFWARGQSVTIIAPTEQDAKTLCAMAKKRAEKCGIPVRDYNLRYDKGSK